MSDFGAVGWQYGYEEGVSDERERIIKLLTNDAYTSRVCDLEYIVTLIRGEEA